MKSNVIRNIAVTVSVFGVRHRIVVTTTKSIPDAVDDIINYLRNNITNTSHMLKVEVEGVVVYSSNVYLRGESIWRKKNQQG